MKKASEEKSTCHCTDRRTVSIVLWIPFLRVVSMLRDDSREQQKCFKILPFTSIWFWSVSLQVINRHVNFKVNGCRVPNGHKI